METCSVTCPHLWSTEDLCKILKERCIVIGKIEELDRPKLIELFKRVALPLAQRKYNEKRYLGKNLLNLRIKKNMNVGDYEENNDISRTVTEPPPTCNRDNSSNSKQNGRIKGPINDLTQVTKRIRLSSDEQIVEKCELNNRKRTSDVPVTDTKKRQKITWP